MRTGFCDCENLSAEKYHHSMSLCMKPNGLQRSIAEINTRPLSLWPSVSKTRYNQAFRLCAACVMGLLFLYGFFFLSCS